MKFSELNTWVEEDWVHGYLTKGNLRIKLCSIKGIIFQAICKQGLEALPSVAQVFVYVEPNEADEDQIQTQAQNQGEIQSSPETPKSANDRLHGYLYPYPNPKPETRKKPGAEV